MSKPRVLPHNVDAEASILGGVLLRNDTMTLIPMLDLEDFYDQRHRVVFQAYRDLEARSRPIDVVTVSAEVARVGKLDAIGGVAFLGELALRVPTPDNVVSYAEIVQEHAVTRRAMLAMAELMELGYTEELAGDAMVSAIAGTALHIKQAKERPILAMRDVINAEAQRIEEDLARRERGEFAFAGIPTGIDTIDQNVGGWPIGLLSLVLARPGVGKSTIGLHVCDVATNKYGEPSLLASYEDAGQTLGQRAIAQGANIDTQALRSRKINGDGYRALAEGIAVGQQREELFLHETGLGVEKLIARVRRENLRRKNAHLKPIRAVHIDHIGRMPMPSYKLFPTKDQQLGHISATLSNWAADDQLAVIAYCQLNRDLEKRDDHRPRLSDIRDSGNLEQDGKFIVGIHRPWLYDQKQPKEDLRLFVLKNHNGENQVEVSLWIDLPTNRIFDNGIDFSRWRGRRM